MPKKHVRFSPDIVDATPASEVSILESRGAPIESIVLTDYLFEDKESTKAFPLRLHLGVLRSGHTYLASVVASCPYPVSIIPVMPDPSGDVAVYARHMRDSPADAVPDVCVLPHHPADASGSQNESDLHISFLVTPKDEGLFTFPVKVLVKRQDVNEVIGHIEAKLIGNSLGKLCPRHTDYANCRCCDRKT
eukprot:Blabericola_migrator_1__2889@NODE_182_length_11861_cov_167_496185_g158_i0_p7_GENE_NODE_182_length_11861_cov_167_496185_g158_i0NODE_182_length_11861_cov_167_496185_g158_i0_p7_ORF_typecomplete_len191_score11_89_NODE_182_length_11861_cov_167_496185_g158_i064317003